MALQRIADGEVHAVRVLVVILGERFLGSRQVYGGAGGGLVVLGGVVILFLVEDLESEVYGTVLDVGLGKPERELAADAAQVCLHAQSFAEAEEVVGLIVDADECAGKAADAAVHADRVLALFLHLEQQFDGSGIRILVGFRVLIDLEGIEILELVEAEQAELP
jgi:hypothetical protein